MADKRTFPYDKMQVLALLWLENQDLTDKTPTEIHSMYENAYLEIVNSETKRISDSRTAKK